MAPVIIKPTLLLRFVLGLAGVMLSLLAALIDLNRIHLITWTRSPAAGLDFTLLIYLLALAALAGGFFLLRWLRRQYFTLPAEDEEDSLQSPVYPGLTIGWLVSLCCLLFAVFFALSLLALDSLGEFIILFPDFTHVPLIGLVAGFCFLPAFVQPGALRHSLAARVCRLLTYRSEASRQEGAPADAPPDVTPDIIGRYRPLVAIAGAGFSLLAALLCLTFYFEFAREIRADAPVEFVPAKGALLKLDLLRDLGWNCAALLLFGLCAWAVHTLLFVQQKKQDIFHKAERADGNIPSPPLRSSPALQLKDITLWEKLLASAYTGAIALITILLIGFGDAWITVLLSGLVAGYFVLPLFFSRDGWQFVRMFFGGALATVLTAGLGAFTYVTLYDSFLGSNLNEALGTTVFALAFSLPFSLIGGLAAVLLDWLLYRRRARNPVFDTTAFE
ncbi:hypothetical protein [Kiloniella laminariae]|uniref:hypothetical protein n=1 Tax=Kiloniella laminariae TaxID=454162 RepID=UPI00036C665F|nr:hypothetical protein [Kiloniella laminariae]